MTRNLGHRRGPPSDLSAAGLAVSPALGVLALAVPRPCPGRAPPVLPLPVPVGFSVSPMGSDSGRDSPVILLSPISAPRLGGRLPGSKEAS